MQEWLKQEGLRVVVVFEGRDAAGKGGVLKRITERVSPRVFRVVALPAPSDREKSQLYVQRYITHFPAAGEVSLFDRSWYNRAGVGRVMGFCDERDYERFLRVCPPWEREIVEQGIILIKYFFDVTQEEQERRFIARATDPMRHWKLSPMDIESWRRWWDYTAAYARMLDATEINDSLIPTPPLSHASLKYGNLAYDESNPRGAQCPQPISSPRTEDVGYVKSMACATCQRENLRYPTPPDVNCSSFG